MEMIRAILPQLSLLVLIMVIAVGFVKKINIGFFSIGAAFLLALLGMAVELQIKSGDTMRLLKASDVAKGFSSSMFVTLVGVTFLFGMAAVLILLGCADEKKAIKSIPWGTLIMICGVGVLVNMISLLGGIDLISDTLASFMTEHTATPIMAATSGILSWVSSTTAVVMPTLYPISAEICQRFAGVNYVELIAAITATSFAAAISPLSTGGAIIMSSYSAARETTTEEMNKMFYTLFLLSVANVCVNVVMAAVGVFGLGGLIGYCSRMRAQQLNMLQPSECDQRILGFYTET